MYIWQAHSIIHVTIKMDVNIAINCSHTLMQRKQKIWLQGSLTGCSAVCKQIEHSGLSGRIQSYFQQITHIASDYLIMVYHIANRDRNDNSRFIVHLKTQGKLTRFRGQRLRIDVSTSCRLSWWKLAGRRGLLTGTSFLRKCFGVVQGQNWYV